MQQMLVIQIHMDWKRPATHKQMRATFQRQKFNQLQSHFNEKFQVKSVHR